MRRSRAPTTRKTHMSQMTVEANDRYAADRCVHCHGNGVRANRND
jgi:hypothetical protein